jgi:hypothetical protein
VTGSTNTSLGPRVCLTFDFDAMATWINVGAANGRPLNFTDLSRGEFAARVGVPAA